MNNNQFRVRVRLRVADCESRVERTMINKQLTMIGFKFVAGCGLRVAGCEGSKKTGTQDRGERTVESGKICCGLRVAGCENNDQ